MSPRLCSTTSPYVGTSLFFKILDYSPNHVLQSNNVIFINKQNNNNNASNVRNVQLKSSMEFQRPKFVRGTTKDRVVNFVATRTD